MTMTFEELSTERKKLQAQGLLPDWYSTQGWQMFKSKYSVPGEKGVKGRFETIAKTLAKQMPENKDYWETTFFDLMWKGWLSPSSPVLSNTGTSRGLNVSCSGTYVGDNVDSFFTVLHENAMLSKYGFGCSADFSDIRPRGSVVSVGGKADGVVPVINLYKTMAEQISQGSTRRGSIACYLDIEHEDFHELADKLLHEPDGLNIGWTVRDSFINRLQNGDKDAQERFTKTLYIKLVTGHGYYFFKDKANRSRPQVYKDLNLDVKASNLCVAPETLVLTRNGHEVISDLEGQFVDVWNGQEWSNVQVVKTGTNQPLVTVKTKCGKSLDCTEYHKFYRFDGSETRAGELKQGEVLLQYTSPESLTEEFVVESVTNTGRKDDTYCFTEPKRNMGVFNGILTGQCSEIMLHSSEHLSYTCVLSSMNLAKYDEWKDTDAIFNATIFLDCVAGDFLENSKHLPGMEKARLFTEKGRALGLGVLGWATYLQTNRIPYASLDAQFMSQEFSKKLHDETLRASKWMAEHLGEPEWCKGYGVRNTHRTAFAPTKSTSILMGNVSESVFPDPGMIYESGSAAGGLKRIVGPLYKLMVERGVYNKETVDRIIQNLGSVQSESWLTDSEKEVFRTAFETDQFSILRYASLRQKYICQGQSLNFYVSEDGDEERIAELHTKAFLDENILSLYYIYSRSGVVVNNTCSVCEA